MEVSIDGEGTLAFHRRNASRVGGMSIRDKRPRLFEIHNSLFNLLSILNTNFYDRLHLCKVLIKIVKVKTKLPQWSALF